MFFQKSHSSSDDKPTHTRRWIIQGYSVFQTGTRFQPPTDVFEIEDRLVVLVEIAGMRAGDFKIRLADQQLTISGHRPRPALENPAYHQVEIGYGDFRIDLRLPWAVNSDMVTASYNDGFLRIDLARQDTMRVHVNVDPEERSQE